MDSEEKIRSLLGFRYSCKEKSSKFPYLFRIERAGCCYATENFEIARDRQYPYYTIHLLFSGYSFFQIAEQHYFLSREDAFIITPGQSHSYSRLNSDSLGLIWFEASGTFCQEIFQSLQTNAVYVLQHALNSPFGEAVISLLQYLQECGEESPYIVSAKIYTVFMALLQQTEASLLEKTPRRFLQIQEHIRQNPGTAFSVGQLADEFQMSTTYLNRLFHRYAGCSTCRYIRKQRMAQACSLLFSSALTCEQIGEALGFYDAAYFYKVFRAEMGLTPLQYRNRYRAQLQSRKRDC